MLRVIYLICLQNHEGQEVIHDEPKSTAMSIMEQAYESKKTQRGKLSLRVGSWANVKSKSLDSQMQWFNSHLNGCVNLDWAISKSVLLNTNSIPSPLVRANTPISKSNQPANQQQQHLNAPSLHHLLSNTPPESYKRSPKSSPHTALHTQNILYPMEINSDSSPWPHGKARSVPPCNMKKSNFLYRC